MYTHKERSFVPFFIVSFVVIILAIGLLWNESFYTVNPGQCALQIRLGRILKAETNPGFYTKIPFIDSVVPMDLRIRKAFPDIETLAMSKDLQPVSVGMVVNYRIKNPLLLYQEIGTQYETIIIDPFTQETLKSVVAKFTAEDLIQRRHEAKDMVIHELAERFATRYIELVDFNFTHLDFSKEFIKAVEEKQIAEQHAKQAKNLTEKIKEEAVQTKTRADAEAYSLNARKAAVTQELIKLQEIEAQIKAIEKWDGKLPQVAGGNSLPLIPLTK
jgi:regulator of protease activity HflC (stomatin/prohibitin superfamily)